MQLSNKSLFEFWAGSDVKFSALKTKAIHPLSPFITSYTYEIGFSAVAALRTKYSSKLNIDKRT